MQLICKIESASCAKGFICENFEFVMGGGRCTRFIKIIRFGASKMTFLADKAHRSEEHARRVENERLMKYSAVIGQ